MSKTNIEIPPHYELLYLIPNKYSEDELAPIIDKVRDIIQTNGGNITLNEQWGRKRLAYPIKSFHFGYYNLLEFDLAADKVAKIERALKLFAEVIRHQLVSKKLKTASQLEEEKRIAEKIAAKTKTEEKIAKEKVKVDLKDLDEKLDKILESEDLL